jgi:hypothetical protein
MSDTRRDATLTIRMYRKVCRPLHWCEACTRRMPRTSARASTISINRAIAARALPRKDSAVSPFASSSNVLKYFTLLTTCSFSPSSRKALAGAHIPGCSITNDFPNSRAFRTTWRTRPTQCAPSTLQHLGELYRPQMLSTSVARRHAAPILGWCSFRSPFPSASCRRSRSVTTQSRRFCECLEQEIRIQVVQRRR